jgi:hypothetical protein
MAIISCWNGVGILNYIRKRLRYVKNSLVAVI